MHAEISCQDFFALQDQITDKISQAGDNLRRLLANKKLLEQLEPVAVDVDRVLLGMQEQDATLVCNEGRRNRTIGPSEISDSPPSIVDNLSRLTLEDDPGMGSSR